MKFPQSNCVRHERKSVMWPISRYCQDHNCSHPLTKAYALSATQQVHRRLQNGCQEAAQHFSADSERWAVHPQRLPECHSTAALSATVALYNRGLQSAIPGGPRGCICANKGRPGTGRPWSNSDSIKKLPMNRVAQGSHSNCQCTIIFATEWNSKRGAKSQ
jgi:hypothetical protein